MHILDIVAKSCRAFAYLFAGLCRFELGDRKGWQADVEQALRTDPLIESNILAGLFLDFEFELEKSRSIIEAVLVVQPDNPYFRCLKQLLPAEWVREKLR